MNPKAFRSALSADLLEKFHRAPWAAWASAREELRNPRPCNLNPGLGVSKNWAGPIAIIRVYWGLYWITPFLGNYHLGLGIGGRHCIPGLLKGWQGLLASGHR